MNSAASFSCCKVAIPYSTRTESLGNRTRHVKKCRTRHVKKGRNESSMEQLHFSLVTIHLFGQYMEFRASTKTQTHSYTQISLFHRRIPSASRKSRSLSPRTLRSRCIIIVLGVHRCLIRRSHTIKGSAMSISFEKCSPCVTAHWVIWLGVPYSAYERSVYVKASNCLTDCGIQCAKEISKKNLVL
jgi:hypothetical protein